MSLVFRGFFMAQYLVEVGGAADGLSCGRESRGANWERFRKTEL